MAAGETTHNAGHAAVEAGANAGDLSQKFSLEQIQEASTHAQELGMPVDQYLQDFMPEHQ